MKYAITPGDIFGNFTVIEQQKGRRNITFTCACVCGKTRNVKAVNLLSGASKQCNNCTKTGRRRFSQYHADFSSILGTYENNARIRSIEFALAPDEFYKLITDTCYYCGSDPSNCRSKKNAIPFYYNGIDRVSNNDIYSVQNCVTCCFVCNRGKSTMSSKEFMDWIDRLIMFRGGHK